MRACFVLLVLAAGCDCGSSHEPGSRDTGPVGVDGGPGSDAGRGSDAGPAPDAGPDCAGTDTSDLPGVRMMFPPQRCRFTLAEAAAGIDVSYQVVISAPASVTTRPQDGGGCGTPGPSGLITFERLEGGGQRYCLCDTGLCPGTEPAVELVAGAYPIAFHWEGRNWDGPSDTGMGMGDPFPPGEYTLHATAVGTVDGRDYTVEATFPIHVLP